MSTHVSLITILSPLPELLEVIKHDSISTQFQSPAPNEIKHISETTSTMLSPESDAKFAALQADYKNFTHHQRQDQDAWAKSCFPKCRAGSWIRVEGGYKCSEKQPQHLVTDGALKERSGEFFQRDVGGKWELKEPESYK